MFVELTKEQIRLLVKDTRKYNVERGQILYD